MVLRTVEVSGEEEMIVHRACGTILAHCSSYRDEMMIIEQTLEAVLLNVDQELEFDRILWIITDSQSSISPLQQVPTQCHRTKYMVTSPKTF